ncbi:hypothetical protein J5N97_028460 [Dioscorea zingiberensis]|uniref:Uncharacterized protein n=1 Tax=Dioscorea zingiberensis TaxID=325984 RepID=A0A9D5BZ12_9LILI|nr:hypothetical protein J5N97_028460 [Dioscorea zingiberensis]
MASGTLSSTRRQPLRVARHPACHAVARVLLALRLGLLTQLPRLGALRPVAAALRPTSACARLPPSLQQRLCSDLRAALRRPARHTAAHAARPPHCSPAGVPATHMPNPCTRLARTVALRPTTLQPLRVAGAARTPLRTPPTRSPYACSSQAAPPCVRAATSLACGPTRRSPSSLAIDVVRRSRT